MPEVEFQVVVGQGGRVHIPKWVRQDLNIEDGDVVYLVVKRVMKRGGRKNSEVQTRNQQ